MCVYVCVCMCIYVCVCVRARVHACVRVCVKIETCERLVLCFIAAIFKRIASEYVTGTDVYGQLPLLRHVGASIGCVARQGRMCSSSSSSRKVDDTGGTLSSLLDCFRD